MKIVTRYSCWFVSLLCLVQIADHRVAFSAGGCPTPQPEYEDLLARLSAFEAAVRKPTAECQGLQTSVVNLLKLYRSPDRAIVVDLTQRMKDNELATDKDWKKLAPLDVERLGNYSEKITGQVSALVRDLAADTECIPEKTKPSVLMSVAAVTKEVTGIAAMYTGPYGVPIALGGAAFAGILQGIDQVIASMNSGYNFDNPEHQSLYGTSLCIYRDIQKEIGDILNPAERLRIITELNTALEEKMRRIQHSGSAHLPNYMVWEKATSQVDTKARRVEAHITEVTALDPIEACSRLSELAHDPLSAFRQLEAQIATNFPNPETMPHALQQALTDFGFSRGDSGVPTRQTCLFQMEPEAAQKRNQRTISQIREISRVVVRSYRAVIDALYQAAEPPAGTVDGVNYIYWYRGTFERQAWARAELRKLMRLNEPGSNIARARINRLNIELDRKFYSVLAPKFVEWHREAAESAISKFESDYDATGERIADQMEPLLRRLGLYERYRTHLESLALTVRLFAREPRLKNGIDHPHFYASVSELLPNLYAGTYSLGVVKEYCTYLSNAGKKYVALEDECNGETIQNLSLSVSNLKYIPDAFAEYFQWAHQNSFVEADWILQLIQSIRDCYIKLPPVPPRKRPRRVS